MNTSDSFAADDDDQPDRDGSQDRPETIFNDRDDQSQTALKNSDYDTIGSLLSPSDSLIGETVTLNLESGSTIGNFRLISRLGIGGYGAVYKADDLRLGRQVAIKVTHGSGSADADEYYKRVFHEGRAAAALDHPNIVSIYDVASREGKPYIVSQLIDGITLRERMKQSRLRHRDAAKSLILIARAIEYAHDRGIIHRDLKPSNILLDRNGTPYVSDFGIAKHESSDETISHESSIIGTPSYMSPEQAAGRSKHVDRRSDLYSLGVIMYELLTGERPFRGSTQMLIQQVIHTDPPLPRLLDSSVPRDLETICLKCLDKNPNRRYESCGEFADELQRFLDGTPILARPISRPEKFLRLCQRNPASATLGLTAILAVCIGLAGVTWQWRRAEHSRRLESIAREQVETSRTKLAEQFDRSQSLLHNAESILVYRALSSGDHRRAKSLFEQLPKKFGIDYRFLKNQLTKTVVVAGHIEPTTDIALSDDERFVAATGLRTLLVWDSATERIVHRYREKGKQLRAVAFRPDSHLLAWGGESGDVHFHEIGQPERQRRQLKHGAPINVVQFSNNGEHLFSAGDDGRVVKWSVETGKPSEPIAVEQSPILCADVISDFELVTGHDNGKIFRVNIQSGDSRLIQQRRFSVLSIDVSDDGSLMACGAKNNQFEVGSFENPAERKIYDNLGGPIMDVHFADNQNSLVTADLFGRICVWPLTDQQTGFQYSLKQGHNHIAVGPQSGQVLIGSGGGSIVRVQSTATFPDMIHDKDGGIRKILISGSTFVVCHDQGTATVFDRQTGLRLQTIGKPVGAKNRGQGIPMDTLTCVDQSDAGESLVFGTNQGQLAVWKSGDGRLRRVGPPNEESISSIKVGSAGRYAITGSINGTIRWWDLSAAESSEVIVKHLGVVRGLCLSPDEKRCVGVTAAGTAVLIDVANRTQIMTSDLQHPGHCVAFSPDGRQLAIGTAQGRILRLSPDLSTELGVIDAHIGSINELAYCDNGETIVSVGNDNYLAFSSTKMNRTGLKSQQVHEKSVRALAISPDEQWMVTGDTEGKIQIWNTNEN
tara:strand:- start:44776 stop:47940 length:3165 start_codon:yes stop_codon:yes gene_type:complete